MIDSIVKGDWANGIMVFLIRSEDNSNGTTVTHLISVSINLLVVYRESVNLIGYITVHYQLIVARVIVYVTLFQTWISTHGANGAPRLNLMKHNETVLFYALLDTFFSFMQWDYE